IRNQCVAFFWRRKKDEDKFSTSVLGLDKSIEELKKREEEAERAIGVRFYNAIEKTRYSINNKLDTILENCKHIDEQSLDELEERIKDEDNAVLICAAETFRAAASDQLEIWAERAGVQIVQQKQGTDPAAVLFDALKAAKARSADVLIVDTAGRLHNKAHLMAELEKMKRVAGREVPGAPHETLL